ncbi:LexA family protein [Pseudomonas sp. NFX71]|jgi:DNA polymerase V|uniref:LexA family protein n=1 Tax=Pseudomonas sp. NFX71 TaxID=3399121 RepID=UPI003A8A12FB
MKAIDVRPLVPSDEPELMQQLGQLACGFPSPGLDHEEPSLSLDELVGMRAPSMFVGRATGKSMTGKGIFDRDFLIINRALTPAQDDVIVARIGSEFTVKTYCVSNGVPFLQAENPLCAPIRLGDSEEIEVWGVVTFNLHPLRGAFA